MNFIEIIMQNIMGYDALIWVVAIINLVLYIKIKSNTNEINKELHPKKNIPLSTMLEVYISQNSKGSIDKERIEIKKLDKLFEKEDKAKKFFSIFISITSIFPLMGIAGTVLALLMVQDFSSEIVVNNFSSALTSTLWGVVWGGICKICEGFIEPLLSQNNEELRIIRQILKKDKAGESLE